MKRLFVNCLQQKNEPEWMLEFRLKSFETFKKMPMQTWGADLSEIDFDDLIHYQKPSDKPCPFMGRSSRENQGNL